MDLDRDERLAELEARVARLERKIERAIEGSASFEPEDVAESSHTSTPSKGAEYWIGAKFVPRFGAILIVLAIAFVAISESSKNPMVDRTILLVGEAVFCLAFIAFGEWRRNEMEGFGPTLSAIGACGLYLTAAGGHFAYGELSGAGMAIGFALLTLLNHAFAVWRNTRLFFFIGATGGLAAMLFPLSDKDYSTALAVYVAVTVAGAVVCAKRRWAQLALVGWFLSLLIIVPIIDSEQSRATVVLSMYAGALACVAAYARACTSRDPWAVGAPIALFFTGLVGFWVVSSPAGVAHLLLLSAVGCAIALTLSGSTACRNALLVGSIATVGVLGPLCFSPSVATVAYSAFALVAYAIGRSTLRRVSAIFAVAAIVAAGCAYLGALAMGPQLSDGMLLVGLSGGLAASVFALRNAGWGNLGLAVAGSWLLLTRAAVLISPAVGHGLASYSTPTLVTLGYALLLFALGFRLESTTLRMWSFAAMLGGVFQILVFDKGTAVGFRIATLVVAGVMMLVSGYRYVHDQRAASEEEAPPQTTPDATPAGRA
ncbi:MAG: DUF2339 domain-containing protein [Fimbriimonadaceae bacterium]|nr:DUF2339 domain-containing protein [Chthonomonadaceae bacterium]MCO5295751.1 DUF2339 domain-containing protein [Fimbriimonadaceae bacterium]